ncbi:hypothetical protein AAFF_G00182750 [Aldrovandia affinis]|uniref:Transmembrane protein n=1 Tax=Aldrovandia affinis TaxID=143900 RepID=A0AAD7RKF0_9TELE|nr:hypothetical protein AAFF_G00182750 [Aldrovandia affinis]
MKRDWRDGCCLTVLVVTLQLAIAGQLVFALIVSDAEFVRTADVLLSPYGFCMRRPPNAGFECRPVSSSGPVCTMLVLCLYSPLPLTLFAALAYLFGTFGADDSLLRFSVATQALGSATMLLGVAAFISASWRYLWPAGLTAAYYLSVCTCAEMAAVAALAQWSAARSARCEVTL